MNATSQQAWSENPDNACAANGVTPDGRPYHYSAAHNGYVFDELSAEPAFREPVCARCGAAICLTPDDSPLTPGTAYWELAQDWTSGPGAASRMCAESPDYLHHPV